MIHPIQTHPRAGWDKAFQAMHEKREDQLLVNDWIVYQVEENHLLILVVRVGHRKEVYRHLP